MSNKTVAIFGVFDGVHEGHLFFIKEAKKQGNHLVAIVARDNIVKELKGKSPRYTEAQRVNELLKIEDIDLVLLGDPKLETYHVLKEVNPNIIYLGYDQEDLLENLNKVVKNGDLSEVEIVCGESYNPEIFHSSILNKNK
ncbi:MAG: adenylyltransferase/cytidyltransferase family protein [Candidatus Paceibacterota bacterium]|jgi:FAD synthetase